MVDVKTEFTLQKYKEIFECVPLQKLSKNEKRLVKQVLSDKNDFTDKEWSTLEGVVSRYGEAVEKVDASTLLENQEKVIETIHTEHELLDLLEQEQSNHYLTVDLPLQSGKHRVTFEVLPISDSRALTTLESHASLFNDFTVEEKNLFNNGQNNPESLTQAETEVYEALVERLNNNALANSEEMIIELLSHQLKIKDTTSVNVETNKKIWSKMPFNVKMAIFLRVEDLLGLNDFDTEELFPVTQ